MLNPIHPDSRQCTDTIQSARQREKNQEKKPHVRDKLHRDQEGIDNGVQLLKFTGEDILSTFSAHVICAWKAIIVLNVQGTGKWFGIGRQPSPPPPFNSEIPKKKILF